MVRLAQLCGELNILQVFWGGSRGVFLARVGEPAGCDGMLWSVRLARYTLPSLLQEQGTYRLDPSDRAQPPHPAQNKTPLPNW